VLGFHRHRRRRLCTAFSDHDWEEVTERLGWNDNYLVLKKPFDRGSAERARAGAKRRATLATLEQARRTLEVTLAIDRAAHTRQTVRLPLAED